MLSSLILAAVFVIFQQPGAQTGIVAGKVTIPDDHPVTQPVRVILLSPRYTNLWDTDVQKRLDMYWERYKPAFAQNKEFFLEISRKAQVEALDYVLSRMRRDPSANLSDYIHEATKDGKFEFKSIPFGEYKILAVGKAQNLDLIWQESVDIRNPIPQFLELKKPLP